MNKDYEEKRTKYRVEFFRRSKSFQDFRILSKGNKKTLWVEFKKYWPEFSEAHFGLSPIEVVYDEKDLVCGRLHYSEKDHFQEIYELGKELPKIGVRLSLDGVDQKDKTITIRIHLDRKREDIMKGLEYLLSTLKKEAKYFGKDFKRPKPHWDEFDKYLDVYDLRKEGKSWKKIASQVFPNDRSNDSGIRKVRHYYNQVLKMINGGWRLL